MHKLPSTENSNLNTLVSTARNQLKLQRARKSKKLPSKMFSSESLFADSKSRDYILLL